MSRDPASLVGTVVADRYRVNRVLGSGSNGAVCEVVDVTTGRAGALKLLLGEDPDLAARLEREGKALSMLAHPHIVELVDTGRLDDGSPYVVTELVIGESLQDVIDTTIVIEPLRALGIVRQLLEALHHAHAAGLIHRDIKPDNIMLANGGWDEGDFVKLIDFGVAKVLDPNVLDEQKLTRAGLEVFGTPEYMAPETVAGEPVDARTDVYSVGIVLFELLIGRVPFEDPERVTLMRKHLTDRPPLLREAAPKRAFPVELEQLVAQALDKLPDRRYASAMAMHAAVQTVARALAEPAERPVTSPPLPPRLPPSAGRQAIERPVVAAPRSSAWQRAGRWLRTQRDAARRHPGRTAAIGTGAIALVVILVVALGGGSSTATIDTKPVRPITEPVDKPPPPAPATHAIVQQADDDVAKKRFARAIAGYERALVADKTLARDDKLRAAVAKIAARGDQVPAVIALDMLSRLDPPDRKTIAELASTSRVFEVRRRAFAIAERDGFVASVDRYQSFTLDLLQGTCDDRKDAIGKLRELGDKRAVEPLQKLARALPCVAKDANAAIEQLQPPEPPP